MKARVDAAALHEALGGSVAQRGAMEILEHALIRAEAGADGTWVTVTTTDMRQTLSLTLPAEEVTPGTMTAPVAQLRAALTGLEGPATLSHDGKKGGALSAPAARGTRRYRLTSLDPEAFPVQDDGEATMRLPVTPEALLAGLQAVAYAPLASYTGKIYDNGICVDPRKVAGTDGYRVAIREWLDSDGPLPADDAFPVLVVPREAVKTLVGLIKRGAEHLDLLCNSGGRPTGLRLEAPFCRYTTGLLDTAFPDATRLVPSFAKLTKTPYVIQGPALRAALTRLLPFTCPGSKFGRVVLTPGDGVVRLAADDSDTVDEVVAEGGTGGEGEGLPVRLEPGYLADVANLAGAEALCWYPRAPDDPQVFTIEGRGIHLIAPQRK